MVLVRRKRVLFHDVPDSIRHLSPGNKLPDPGLYPSPEAKALAADPEVFYIQETGEVFLDYESYAARMTFYKSNIFMCEVTGKTGLDYFQAAESERSESNNLHARFPEQLKAAVLRAVQWQIVGRLDHLVEAVYDRYKDRYFKGEKVYVDVQGDKYLARIIKVFPPRNLKSSSSPMKLKLKLSNGTPSGSTSPPPSTHSSSEPSKAPSKYRPSPNQRVARSYPGASHIPPASSPLAICNEDVKPIIDTPPSTQATAVDVPIHSIGADLKLSLEEANKLDDPHAYYYSVQMIGAGENDAADGPGAPDVDTNKYAGSEMEVTCTALSRDRLGFNKALLKRFMKDALERDNAAASPWVVKKDLAEKYGIETEMPPDVREGVEGVKKADHEKRKRIWEERGGGAGGDGSDSVANGPAGKKRKLNEDEKAARDAQSHQRQAELDRLEQAAEDAMRKAAQAKKRGVRYPTEDLDVKLSDKDRKAGKIVCRPSMDRDVPFGSAFEAFAMSWSFLQTFGKPLGISAFSMDEYEKALRHSLIDPPCRLIADVHLCLINMIRERPFDRHAAVVSLLELKDGDSPQAIKAGQAEKDDDWQVEIDELLGAVADIGVSWESTIPSVLSSDVRDGWECVLIGFLKDYATTATFPRLRPILTSLVYGPSPPENDDESSTGSVVEPCHPADRYPSLPPEDKINIIQFLCELTIPCKPIRSTLEAAEADLTELRKEKIELNREKKKLTDEAAQQNGSEGAPLTKGNLESNTKAQGDATPVNGTSDMDVDSERMIDASSDVASEYGEGSSRATSVANGRNGKVDTSNPTPKTIALARERALAREKAAEAKVAQANNRRREDDVAKLDRRLEAIEREFRQMLGLGRSKPLGRDRFYNRIWWFDGLGSAGLLNRSGDVSYGSGRLFIQGPSEIDLEVMHGRPDFADVIAARRVEEEGEGMSLKSGEWACYQEPEQVETFMTWLNVKGHREFQLDRTMKLWWDYVVPGMKKRQLDLAAGPRPPETSSGRRTSKGKGKDSELLRESYMAWRDRKSVV